VVRRDGTVLADGGSRTSRLCDGIIGEIVAAALEQGRLKRASSADHVLSAGHPADDRDGPDAGRGAERTNLGPSIRIATATCIPGRRPDPLLASGSAKVEGILSQRVAQFEGSEF